MRDVAQSVAHMSDPGFLADVKYVLGLALAAQGRHDEAQREYADAVRHLLEIADKLATADDRAAFLSHPGRSRILEAGQ